MPDALEEFTPTAKRLAPTVIRETEYYTYFSDGTRALKVPITPTGNAVQTAGMSPWFLILGIGLLWLMQRK